MLSALTKSTVASLMWYRNNSRHPEGTVHAVISCSISDEYHELTQWQSLVSISSAAVGAMNTIDIRINSEDIVHRDSSCDEHSNDV